MTFNKISRLPVIGDLAGVYFVYNTDTPRINGIYVKSTDNGDVVNMSTPINHTHSYNNLTDKPDLTLYELKGSEPLNISPHNPINVDIVYNMEDWSNQKVLITTTHNIDISYSNFIGANILLFDMAITSTLTSCDFKMAHFGDAIDTLNFGMNSCDFYGAVGKLFETATPNPALIIGRHGDNIRWWNGDSFLNNHGTSWIIHPTPSEIWDTINIMITTPETSAP